MIALFTATLTLRCPATLGLEGSTTSQNASRLAPLAPQHEGEMNIRSLTLRCSAQQSLEGRHGREG